MSFERKFFLSVVGAKILLLILFLLIFGPARLIWSDSTVYITLGENIFSGRGFVSIFGTPNAVRTPFYPLLVGFFLTYVPYGLVAVSLLQAFADGVSAILLFRIAGRFISVRAAAAVALFFLFEPLSLVLHIFILPEAFLVLLVLAFTYLFLRYLGDTRRTRSLVGAALALGGAILTKPIALYLFLVPIGWLLVHKQLRHTLVFALVVLVIVVGWMGRNYAVFGRLDVSNDDVGNLCGYELPAVFATKHSRDSSNWDAVFFLPDFLNAHQRCVSTFSALRILLLEEPIAFAKTSALSAVAFMTNEGYAPFFERPGMPSLKIHNNYLTPAVFTNADWREKIAAAAGALRPWELAVVIAARVYWVLVTVGACVGMWLLIVRKKTPHAGLLAAIVFYIVVATVVSTGYGVGARLRHPAAPFLLIFAATAVNKNHRLFFTVR